MKQFHQTHHWRHGALRSELAIHKLVWHGLRSNRGALYTRLSFHLLKINTTGRAVRPIHGAIWTKVVLLCEGVGSKALHVYNRICHPSINITSWTFEGIRACMKFPYIMLALKDMNIATNIWGYINDQRSRGWAETAFSRFLFKRTCWGDWARRRGGEGANAVLWIGCPTTSVMPTGDLLQLRHRQASPSLEANRTWVLLSPDNQWLASSRSRLSNSITCHSPHQTREEVLQGSNHDKNIRHSGGWDAVKSLHP